jgi:hypothetical protein
MNKKVGEACRFSLHFKTNLAGNKLSGTLDFFVFSLMQLCIPGYK